MKMIAAGSADISNYGPYSKNCNRNNCTQPFFVPVPSLCEGVQLYINFGSSAPGAVTFTMIDLCNETSASATCSCSVIGYNAIGGYWYGIFKQLASGANYDSYIIAAQSGGLTWFSEQYMNAQACDTLTKVSVCYPYNYNDEDINSIYVGAPDPSHTITGIATMFYQHTYWVRAAEIVETQNKITFNANPFKTFSSQLNRLFEFRPELVPGWYKDYLLAVYFRGNILLNDVPTMVTDLAFENVDEGADSWKAYPVLGKQVNGVFGCAPITCLVDCAPCGTPPPPPPPPPPPCIAVGIVAGQTLPDAKAGNDYINSLNITGDAPFVISNIVKPAWMNTPVISGNTVVFGGTPANSDVSTGITISFTVTNCNGASSANFSQTINVIEGGARFGDTTFVSGDDLNDVEVANLIGLPGSTVTVTLETLTNNNGGQLKVNGFAVIATGGTWDVVLDGSGNGTLDVEIDGVTNPSSAINAVFQVTAVSTGIIGSPNTYQITKVFS